MIPKEDVARGRRLGAFCDLVADRPVEWGVDDCSTWPLQWVVSETGRECDVPAYHSREEANAIIEACGGLVHVWERAAGQLGLTECHDGWLPVGSVGLVQLCSTVVGCVFGFANLGCFRVDFDPANRREGEKGWKMWGVRPHLILKAWAL